MPANKRTERKTWYKLDLSAIVYPTLQRRDFSSVYRLSVVLKEPVRPDILQQAVDTALSKILLHRQFDRRVMQNIQESVRWHRLTLRP